MLVARAALVPCGRAEPSHGQDVLWLQLCLTCMEPSARPLRRVPLNPFHPNLHTARCSSFTRAPLLFMLTYAAGAAALSSLLIAHANL